MQSFLKSSSTDSDALEMKSKNKNKLTLFTSPNFLHKPKTSIFASSSTPLEKNTCAFLPTMLDWKPTERNLQEKKGASFNTDNHTAQNKSIHAVSDADKSLQKTVRVFLIFLNEDENLH